MNPTEIIKIWIENDQATYETAREIVQSVFPVLEKTDNKDRFAIITTLADELNNWLDDNKPELSEYGMWGYGMWQDLMNHAFNQVNWVDLAYDLLEQFSEGHISR